MLVSVESSDKFDTDTLAVDCSDEEFRTIETSQHQVFAQNNSKRTTETSPTNTRTARIRSVARNCKEIRSDSRRCGAIRRHPEDVHQ